MIMDVQCSEVNIIDKFLTIALKKSGRMKSKAKNYLNQTTSQQHHETNYEHEGSYKKKVRKTLGNQDDIEQKDRWNTSVGNISAYYSPPKNKPQPTEMDRLIQQNRILKEQVKSLKSLLLDSSVYSKTYDKIQRQKHRKQGQPQTQKLKKIIQKSYYSIKQMQNEILNLKQKLLKATSSLRLMQKKYKILQFQNSQLEHKINNNNLIHREEIDVLHQRIRKLDILTGQLVEMVEQDQRNWAAHMQELNGIKKFYSGRTYK